MSRRINVTVTGYGVADLYVAPEVKERVGSLQKLASM